MLFKKLFWCVVFGLVLTELSYSAVIFHASFEEEDWQATYAKGNPKPEVVGEVSSVEGRIGRGILVGKGHLRYEVEGNLNPRSGTIEMWVKPLWNVSEEKGFCFFSAEAERRVPGVFRIYKLGSNAIIFYWGCSRSEDFARKPLVSWSIKDWQEGSWHHIVASWDSSGGGLRMTLYIDGKMTRRIAGTTFSQKVKEEDYIGKLGDFFNIGGPQWLNAHENAVIDELIIYDRKLTKSEVQKRFMSKTRKYIMREGPATRKFTRNIIPLSFVEKAPRIDGLIEIDEYPGQLPGLIDTETHVLYPKEAILYLGYDKENLYLAFSLELPENYIPVSITNKRDDGAQVAQGDFFCLMIRQDTDLKARSFAGTYITIAPNSNIYDAWEEIGWGNGFRGCIRDADKNLDIEVKSKVSDQKWIMEMAIPLKQLGLDKKRPFSLSAGIKLGDQKLALINHPIWFDHYQAFSQVVFSPIGMKLDLGNPGRGELSPVFRLTNRGEEKVLINVNCRLAIPIIMRIGTKGADMDVLLGEEVKVDLIGEKGALQKEFSLLPNESVELRGDFALAKAGVYLLETIIEVGRETILEKQIPFAFFPPLKVKLKPIPGKDMIKADVSLHGMCEEIVDKIDKIGFLFSLREKRFLNEVFALPEDTRESTFKFSMASLPPGTYEVKAYLLDREGKELTRYDSEFKKWAEPDWLKHRKGIAALEPDWVPSSWVPIEVEGNQIHLWGRKYVIEEGSLVKEISSQERSLLASGISVKYITRGREHAFSISSPDFLSKERGRVNIIQTGNSPHFLLSSEQQIEFDGLKRFDISIRPKKNVNVEKLWIEIPLKIENIKFYMSDSVDTWSGGLVRDKDWYRVRYGIWLGSENVGITWFAENFKGWLINSQKPRISVRLKGDTVFMKLLLVNEPSDIEKEIFCTFGLQATPAKPYFSNWRAQRFQGWTWDGPPRTHSITHYISGPLHWSVGFEPRPRSWEVLEDIISHSRKFNQKAFPYMQPFSIGTYGHLRRDTPLIRSPFKETEVGEAWCESFLVKFKKDAERQEEYWYFAEDWNLSPRCIKQQGRYETFDVASLSPNSSWTDFFVYCVYKVLTKGDIDGLYWDLAIPLQNFDREKGFAYYTKDGKLEGTFEMFAARDLYKRVYYLFDKLRGKERKPFILGHLYPFMVYFTSFVDVCFFGEGLKPKNKFDFTRWFLQKELKGGVSGALPPGKEERSFDATAYMAFYGSKAFGIPMLILPQYGYVPEFRHLKELSREILSFTFLHNNLLWPIWITPTPIYEFWEKVEVPFGMGDTIFFPYWENDIVSRPEWIKVSYWQKKGQDDYLVAVANWSDKESEALITLPMSLSRFSLCIDMESGKNIPVGENWKISVPAHDLRVFRFKKQTQ